MIDNGTHWPGMKLKKKTYTPANNKGKTHKTIIKKAQTVDEVLDDESWIIGDQFPSFCD